MGTELVYLSLVIAWSLQYVYMSFMLCPILLYNTFQPFSALCIVEVFQFYIPEHFYNELFQNIITHTLVYCFNNTLTYSNGDGRVTMVSGSRRKCFWLKEPDTVSIVTTGKPICKTQVSMMFLIESGSIIVLWPSTAWKEIKDGYITVTAH